MITLADAVALAPPAPAPDRVLRVLFADHVRYATAPAVRHHVGTIGSLEVAAIVQPMWQQGPLVVPLLSIAGISLVWPPRIDDPDTGPTVLTDLIGYLLPDDLPVHPGQLRTPTMPPGAIAVALGSHLARELADLAVDTNLTRTIELLELLARQTGQGGAALHFATVGPAAGATPRVPPVGDVVANAVVTCEHFAPLDYNAGGYHRVTSACRLAIGCDRWAFVREPRTVDGDPGMPLS